MVNNLLNLIKKTKTKKFINNTFGQGNKFLNKIKN
jgi:hypothetical protein